MAEMKPAVSGHGSCAGKSLHPALPLIAAAGISVPTAKPPSLSARAREWPWEQLVEQTESGFVRQQLRVVNHFPKMPIGVLEIACITAPERVVCRFDDRGAGGRRLLHDRVHLGLAGNIVTKRKIGSARSSDFEAGIMSQAATWPDGELQALLKVEERHGPVFELRADDPACAEPKTIPIERDRALQIIHAQGNDGNPGFHDPPSSELSHWNRSLHPRWFSLGESSGDILRDGSDASKRFSRRRVRSRHDYHLALGDVARISYSPNTSLSSTPGSPMA